MARPEATTFDDEYLLVAFLVSFLGLDFALTCLGVLARVDFCRFETAKKSVINLLPVVIFTSIWDIVCAECIAFW